MTADKQTNDSNDIKVYHWFMDTGKHEWFAYFTNVFTEEELDKIIELGESSNLEEGKIISKEKNINKNVRNSLISWIPISPDSEWLFRKLVDITREANKRYFGFDLHTIQNLQYSVYNKGGHYKDHADIFNQSAMGVRKLSFSVHLSDSSTYKGGDLVIKPGGEEFVVPKERGTIVFFPSYAVHEVTPVTKGTRKTLVSWVIGPNFK